MTATAIYLIPVLGIGGVERAAASLDSLAPSNFDLRVLTIKNYEATHRRLANRPTFLDYCRCLRLLCKDAPDILVVSLWRSCFVGLIFKILRVKYKLVVFLHFPSSVHVLDFVGTALASLVASAVWADSTRTASRRFIARQHGPPKVISFVTQRFLPNSISKVRPIFLFWGRLHPQKNLPRALRLFKKIREHFTNDEAHFYIIGPDNGDLSRVIENVKSLGLNDSVSLLGSKSFDEIRDLAKLGSFYLQTSILEGMAMSVVEAMQLGLVPVVTPVGEIDNYAVDGKNSVMIRDDSAAVDTIVSIIRDESRYRSLRNNAVSSWASAELFSESFLKGCKAVMDCHE